MPLTRLASTLVLSSFLCACEDSPVPAPPAPAPPTAASSPPAPVPPAPPGPREFNAAAEQELHEQWGTAQEQRDAAKAKYLKQRWRFRATVGAFDGLTAVVRPRGLEPVYLRLRSQEERDRLRVGEEYVFEATAEDFTRGIGRHFDDGTVVPEE